jgi:hypothetical protein
VSNPSLYAKAKAKTKRKFDVYPSAYANAYLVKEYKNMGGTYNTPKKNEQGRCGFYEAKRLWPAVMESKLKWCECPVAKTGLDKWFGENWVDIGAKKKDGKYQPCGRKNASKKSGRSYPKCVPAAKAASMTAEEKSSAVSRKRSKRQGIGGKPTMVKTFAAKGGSIYNKPGNSGLFGR